MIENINESVNFDMDNEEEMIIGTKSLKKNIQEEKQATFDRNYVSHLIWLQQFKIKEFFWDPLKWQTFVDASNTTADKAKVIDKMEKFIPL